MLIFFQALFIILIILWLALIILVPVLIKINEQRISKANSKYNEKLKYLREYEKNYIDIYLQELNLPSKDYWKKGYNFYILFQNEKKEFNLITKNHINTANLKLSKMSNDQIFEVIKESFYYYTTLISDIRGYTIKKTKHISDIQFQVKEGNSESYYNNENIYFVYDVKIYTQTKKIEFDTTDEDLVQYFIDNCEEYKINLILG